MLMTPAGVMLSVDELVEPIIPLGWLADRGCRISWSEQGLEVAMSPGAQEPCPGAHPRV